MKEKAFPSKSELKHSQGMDLRDYFAAKAMNAFISKAPAGTAFGANHAETNENFAIASYVMADAMIKARES